MVNEISQSVEQPTQQRDIAHIEHIAQGKYYASMAALLGHNAKPFLTANEIAQARAFDAKEADFAQRAEAHSQDAAKDKARGDLEKFARGEIAVHPPTKADMINRFTEVRRTIRHERRRWAAGCGMGAFLVPIIERALAAVERHRARLKAQERAEADLLHVPFEPSRTVLSIDSQAERLKELLTKVQRQHQAHEDFPTVRDVLRDFIDLDAMPVASADAAPVDPAQPEPMFDEEQAEGKEATQETLAEYLARVAKMERPELVAEAERLGVPVPVGTSNATLREALRETRAATPR